MARHTLTTLVLLVFAAASPATRAQPSDARVRAAAERIYIHGMAAEIARTEIGPDGVPALLRLLDDASFARRDNVVAFLAYLGGRESTPALVALIDRPLRGGVPEEERARLLVPHALGRIAGRGESAALDALLAMTAHRAEGGPIAAAVAAGAFPARMKNDLVDAAIAALALAGEGRARERLEAIAAGQVIPDTARTDAAERAQAAMGILHSPAGSGAEASAGPTSPAVAAVVDRASRTTTHGLSFSNHASVSNPMTTTRLDSLLAESTRRAARADFATDTACCTVVSRVGGGPTFGSQSDGLGTIDTAAELSNVLGQSAGRIKVVNVINYCGGEGTNIIGCGYQPGNGVAVVRMSDLGYEAVLWIHEYGHNIGLPHVTGESRALMNPTDDGQNNGLAAGECAMFHDPDGEAQAMLGDGGSCTDDGDALADPIDNCPTVANDGQADSNRNGIGDACEAGSPLPPDIDLSGRVDGLDLARLGRAFGASSGDSRYDSGSDLNRDGIVDGEDLALLVTDFGKAD